MQRHGTHIQNDNINNKTQKQAKQTQTTLIWFTSLCFYTLFKTLSSLILFNRSVACLLHLSLLYVIFTFTGQKLSQAWSSILYTNKAFFYILIMILVHINYKMSYAYFCPINVAFLYFDYLLLLVLLLLINLCMWNTYLMIKKNVFIYSIKMSNLTNQM